MGLSMRLPLPVGGDPESARRWSLRLGSKGAPSGVRRRGDSPAQTPEAPQVATQDSVDPRSPYIVRRVRAMHSHETIPAHDEPECRGGHATTPLRVMFVCHGDFGSPSNKQAVAFAQGLLDLGHSVLMSMWGDPGTVAAEQIDMRAGFTIRFRREVGPWLFPGELRVAERFRPDILHVFNPRHVTVAVARRYHAALRVPVMVHWEDDELGIRKGVTARSPIRRVGRLGRRLLCYPLPRQGVFVTGTSLAWIRRTAVACDALTPALAEEVARDFAVPCTHILPSTLTASTGANADDSVEELPPVIRQASVVAYTGTVQPESIEDFRLAVRAVAILLAENHNVAFVHAGRSLPRFVLPDIALSEGLPADRAHFCGYLPFYRIQRLLEQVQVLVQPGQPNRYNTLRLPSKVQAYLESGTPTVMFSVGLGELLVDREEILKLRGFDARELADRIAELLEAPELARRVGSGGQRAAYRLFDRRRNAATLVASYRQAIAPPEQSR